MKQPINESNIIISASDNYSISIQPISKNISSQRREGLLTVNEKQLYKMQDDQKWVEGI